MADIKYIKNDEEKSIGWTAYELYDKNIISNNTLLNGLGIDFDKEMSKMKEEQNNLKEISPVDLDWDDPAIKQVLSTNPSFQYAKKVEECMNELVKMGKNDIEEELKNELLINGPNYNGDLYTSNPYNVKVVNIGSVGNNNGGDSFEENQQSKYFTSTHSPVSSWNIVSPALKDKAQKAQGIKEKSKDIYIYKDALSIIKNINDEFSSVSKWASLFILSKNKGKQYVLNCLKSLPTFYISLMNNTYGNNIVEIMANWKNNAPLVDEISPDLLGDEKNASECWEKINQKITNNSISNSLGNIKYETIRGDYPTKISFILIDPVQINMYDWGFYIITETFNDVIFIKDKFLRNPLPNGQLYDNSHLDEAIRSCLGKEFEIPEEISSVEFLKSMWRKKPENFEETEKEVDKILFGDFEEKEVDIGQNKYNHLDI
jgi:hypothetical protein